MSFERLNYDWKWWSPIQQRQSRAPSLFYEEPNLHPAVAEMGELQQRPKCCTLCCLVAGPFLDLHFSFIYSSYTTSAAPYVRCLLVFTSAMVFNSCGSWFTFLSQWETLLRAEKWSQLKHKHWIDERTNDAWNLSFGFSWNTHQQL